MNFSDLSTFLAVAETASFSRAAHQLSITQPAVSKRIAALEDQLGQRLFDRVGRKVHLTQAGTLLAPAARQLLALVADTENQLSHLSTQVSGTLYLATSHHIGLHRLAPVLREFTRHYPQVQMNISFEDSEVAHDLVRQGQVELAVATLNPAGDAGLICEPLWDDPLVFVSAKSNLRQSSMQNLAEQSCILPGPTTYTGRIVTAHFSHQGIALKPSMSTNYLETISMLVSVGLGWSVLPLSMVDRNLVIDVDCPKMARQLGYVSNPSRTLSPAAQAFMQVLNQFGDT
ncbi:MAG: LysR family transcriptional regulator [Pseudomonadales bacterium]|jgi:DNA-binding transcriptional LysR family regulator|nr:LysR family transcriptional regulator [Pseudomonadales bacterium]